MTVSYLITLYNKADYIGGVIDSVLAEQAETGGEIVVYDDCSTDGSTDILEQRAAANPGRIRVLRGETNRGVSTATNRVIEAATQPYIRLIDADDLMVPGSTAQMLRLMKLHDLAFLHGGQRSRDVGVSETQHYRTCIMLDDPVAVVLRHLQATPSSSFFAAAPLKRVLPLPEWVRRTQDFSIFLRIACQGVKMGYINEIVALLPPVYTANNLSSGSAAAYAEQCRSVALDEKVIPLTHLRNVNRRYAARALRYFRNEGQSKLSSAERFRLWRWRQFTRVASPKTCVIRLGKIADIFDRDRHVVKGLRKAQ